MNEYPLISIVTAVRNGAPYLRALIESVLQQDYPNFEHIIIDDGSNDDEATVDILRSYPHLRWWSRSNKGQYLTQNEGIAAARGAIISVISADDIYLTQDTFTRVYEYWRSNPECKVIYGKTLRMDKQGKLLPYQVEINGKYPRWLLRYYPYIQHCSLFVARDLIVSRDIWFDPSYKYAGDWDWIIRVCSASSQIGYLDHFLAILRMHERQTSRVAALEAVVQEHRKVCAKYGASYRVHVLLKKLVSYRAMTLIAAAALRSGGPRELIELGRNWLYRRRGKLQRTQ